MTFLILSLAVWRISSLLVREDGPFDIFLRLRSKAGVRYDEYSKPQYLTVWAGILSCMWCCSVWVGLFVGLFTRPDSIQDYFITSFALSALAIFVDEVLQRITMKEIT